MKNSHSRCRRGFTLVEILIVIAVIALLSAILLPALGRARESARTKVCLSNMKQLGLAFQQYVNDNGRRYPGAGQYQRWGNGGHWVKGTNSDSATGDPGSLALVATDAGKYRDGVSADVEGGAIYNYVKSPQVYACPSNADGENKKLTYSMNCAIAGMHDVRMNQPAEIILLVDEDKANDGYWYARTGTNSTDALTQAHNKGGNLLFADGHVKYYPFDVYPLNSTADALKTRLTGTPRFYDTSFGTTGFFNPTPASALGGCGTL